MRKINVTILLTLFSYNTLCALEVDREVMPDIAASGEMITTIDIRDFDSTNDKQTKINIDDSSIILHFTKPDFHGGVTGANVGFKESEKTAKFHQLNTFYTNRHILMKAGRMITPHHFVELPVLRDEDFLDYSYIGNGSSNSEFDQQFSKSLIGKWYFDTKNQAIEVVVSLLEKSDSLNTPKGFNFFGAGYTYEPNEDVYYIQRVRQFGIGWRKQKYQVSLDNTGSNVFITGIDLNMNINPQYNWSLGGQYIINEGIPGVTQAEINDTINAVANKARARYQSGVLFLRYTHRPLLLTRWQAALSFGHKQFSKISGANQWTIAPSFKYRLGMGFDLIAQYKHTHHGRAINSGKHDKLLQIGLVFDFDMHIRKTMTDRNSILEQLDKD